MSVASLKEETERELAALALAGEDAELGATDDLPNLTSVPMDARRRRFVLLKTICHLIPRHLRPGDRIRVTWNPGPDALGVHVITLADNIGIEFAGQRWNYDESFLEAVLREMVSDP